MKNKLFEKFTKTGKIIDYLKYKENENKEKNKNGEGNSLKKY